MIFHRALAFALVALSIPALALAQNISGVVIDQTGLPLPGVQIEVKRGADVMTSTVSGADGTFSIANVAPDDVVNLTLDGFEPAKIPVSRASHIVLEVAHATETTTVVASVLTSSPRRISASLLTGSACSSPGCRRSRSPVSTRPMSGGCFGMSRGEGKGGDEGCGLV